MGDDDDDDGDKDDDVTDKVLPEAKIPINGVCFCYLYTPRNLEHMYKHVKPLLPCFPRMCLIHFCVPMIITP